MTLITIPTVDARTLEMFMIGRDSPLEMFGGSEVIMETIAGETKWGVSIPLALEDASEAVKRSWRSALVQLSHLTNTFKLAPPDWSGNGASYLGANPVVKGPNQLGLSLDCDGVDISSSIALEGDWIEVDSQLKCLTSDADSDGSGNVTVTFDPPLRAAPGDNVTVDVKTPKLTLRLLSPRVGWAVTKPDFYDITIQAVEAFPAT